MKNLKQNKKGFSLVELIIAVAVLAIIVVPLLRMFTISQKMSTKSINYTQATMAAQNILKTVEARPVSDFYSLNETDDNAIAKQQLLAEMMSSGADGVTFANGIDSSRIPYMNTVLTDTKEFISVMSGIKSGSAEYDAIVTFDRGDENDTNSDGIKEINDHQIAEYDKMDAVFCQPYIDEENPDTRADIELKAQAASRFGKAIDEEPDSKIREINIKAYQDAEDGEEGDDTITCYVDYTYQYTYKNVKEGETTYGSRTITTTYTYAIFPGGYEYDGSLIAIYIMYYPWTYSTDTISVYNNTDYTNPLNLSVYLYMQEPDTITNKNAYKQDVEYYMPDGYEIASEDESDPDAFSADTLIYTNAKGIGEFHFYVSQGYGWVDRTEHDAKVTGDMVKRKDNKLLYNVTVEIYEKGAVTVNATDHTISVDGDPIYTVTGSKSQT